MLAKSELIRKSLELHLFSLRIMKQQAFFLRLGFMPKDKRLMQEADALRFECDKLLSEVISLSMGVISSEAVKSGAISTPYTLQTEMKSVYFTGVSINTNITKAEQGLRGGIMKSSSPMLEKQVSRINNNAINLITNLITFASKVLSDSLSCKIFISNYPFYLGHIIEESKFYLKAAQNLQKCKDISIKLPVYKQILFWNKVMENQTIIIYHLLDPSERELIAGAESFIEEFNSLTDQLKRAVEKELPTTLIMKDIVRVTKEIQDFKSQITQGILECKIKSTIIPLLADHALRKANYYLWLLKDIC